MPLDYDAKNTGASNPAQNDQTGGLTQSPAITSGGKPTRKAIKDASQAREVVKTLIAANRTRQIVNSRIRAKYDSERPYDQHKLESEGLGWRSNFTTKPLASLVEKVYPRFSEAVLSLKYFTNSSLPHTVSGATAKTETFRSGITKLMRTRKGWRVLIEDIALEDSMFGNNVAAWLDEFSWFPKSFKQDESFLSDGTKQISDNAQVLVLKETLLPHELFEQIEDREAAKTVGWDLGKTIKCINAASPAQLRDNLTTGGNLDIWYQNAYRELTLGTSYTAGASVVVVYNLLAREVTGEVSHYRLAGEGMDLIFQKDDRFKSMTDCLTFYSFQKGNGTMAGSKGVGREIYEFAAMLDRLRNEVVDRSILSGKTLLQGDMKTLNKFKMSVLGNMMMIPNNWTVAETRIDGNVEPFLKLDGYMGQLADSLVGSVSPRQLQGERVTAAQVNLYAGREEEAKDTKINRFLEQFVDMVGCMQRRICSPDVVDKDAKEFQKDMKEAGITKEELKMLSEQPVAGTVRDLTAFERQLIVSIAAEKKGNPLYNARALENEDLNARVDADFAAKVLLPDNDPTEKAEQSRQQQIEWSILQKGEPVPVSPRDNHEIHVGILMPIAEQVGAALQGGQTGTAVFEAVVAHINEHFQQATQAGAPKEFLAPIKVFLDKAIPMIAELHKLDEGAQQVQQASQAHDEEIAAEANQPEQALLAQ